MNDGMYELHAHGGVLKGHALIVNDSVVSVSNPYIRYKGWSYQELANHFNKRSRKRKGWKMTNVLPR